VRLEEAVASYRNAMRVFTLEANPQQFGSLQQNISRLPTTSYPEAPNVAPSKAPLIEKSFSGAKYSSRISP
jgi:hypothetical protein